MSEQALAATPHRELPRARGKTAIFIATLTVFCSRPVQERRKRLVISQYRRCLKRELRILPIERTVELLYIVYIADFFFMFGAVVECLLRVRVIAGSSPGKASFI